MPNGVPELAGSELLDKISKLSERELHDEFKIAGIRREITLLKNSNSFRGYAVLGELEFRLGNFDAAKSAYKNAFARNSTDNVANYNYALSLFRHCFVAESLEEFIRSFKISNDLKDLRELIKASVASLSYDVASDYMDRFQSMSINVDNKMDEAMLTSAKNMKEFFNENNLSEEWTSNLSDIVWGVLRDNNIKKFASWGNNLHPDNRVAFSISLELTPVKVSELNLELASRLSMSDIPFSVTDKIVVGYLAE